MDPELEDMILEQRLRDAEYRRAFLSGIDKTEVKQNVVGNRQKAQRC